MVVVRFQVGVIYNGILHQLEVESHERVQSILARAIASFAITQQPHLLGLFTAANQELSDASSAEAAGIVPGATLYLRPSSVRGGRIC
jgi:hypothetical protein